MNNKGIALVLVLLVVVLLMVIVLEFSFAMKVEITATQNSKDETDCYFYAQSGFQQAVAEGRARSIKILGRHYVREEDVNAYNRRKVQVKI